MTVNAPGQPADVWGAIQAAYASADAAAARLDAAGMYADCASDFAERYEGRRLSLTNRRRETETFLQVRPKLTQTTEVETITVHGSQAVVIARKLQYVLTGYGAAGMTAPGTPGARENWMLTDLTARDIWRKSGSHWLRVTSRPQAYRATWDAGNGIQHAESNTPSGPPGRTP